ncbi:hypothetical protein MD484_g7575, partial [Candolleomyces efflorescens]
MSEVASSNSDYDEQKELVLPDLEEVIEIEDSSFAQSLYCDLASDSAIDNFLKKSRFFSLTEQRWNLPRSYTKLIDTNFYTPVVNIVSSIVKHFWRDASAQKTRRVIDTHRTDLDHSKCDPSSHKSRPSLVIRAEGPSFQVPAAPSGRRLSKIGFSNVAGCIEIQVEGAEIPVSDQLIRVAIYASGAQYTPSIDINEDARTFVRLVLGLSSPNESDLGLDSSIQWRIQDGRKVGGTLTAGGLDGTEIVYPLLSVEPFFRRTEMRGRCTTCWLVSDPSNGNRLLVKDSFRTADRPSELIHLQEALGTPGVVQMVSCVPDRGQTKDFRGFQDTLPINFMNRVETRVVMRCYGGSILNFKSAMQLLCALRDAIAGHKELFKRGSLHRDVSIDNVVLGEPGAEVGDLGVLIDLDMATRRGEDGCHPPANWQIGISLYQSRAVLASKYLQRILPHDHLDDLESFLYILTHIVYSYDRHGVLHQFHDMLINWDECESMLAQDSRESYLAGRVVPMNVSKRWPDALIRVLLDFKAFLLPLSDKKVEIMRGLSDDEEGVLETIKLNAESHYDDVIRLFNTGISALKDEDDETPLHDSPIPRRRLPARAKALELRELLQL